MDVSIIFLVISYTAFFFVMKLQEHSHMLMFSILSTFGAAVYLFLNSALIGSVVCVIAGVASIAQIFLNSSHSVACSKLKNLTATIFSIIAVGILYQKPSDLLPCIAFTQNRLFEAQGSAQYVRLGALFGTALWAMYAFINQLYIMMAVEISISMYAFFCLLHFGKLMKTNSVMST